MTDNILRGRFQYHRREGKQIGQQEHLRKVVFSAGALA